jgi:hypothetical protein
MVFARILEGGATRPPRPADTRSQLGPIGTAGDLPSRVEVDGESLIGELMGCCCAHGPRCWHEGPVYRDCAYDPSPYRARRRRRRYDEEELGAYLEDLEDEIREVRRLLEDARAVAGGGDS